MIARFSIYMESEVYVQRDAVLPDREMKQDDLIVRIYPPRQALIDPRDLDFTAQTSLEEIVEGLVPASLPIISDNLFTNDKPVFKANLICMDFMKDQFDRPRPSDVNSNANVDPPLPLVFSIANRVLVGLRALSRGQRLRPLNEHSTLWRLEYLNDIGEQLPFEEGSFRT